jgi:hypothetical protein
MTATATDTTILHDIARDLQQVWTLCDASSRLLDDANRQDANQIAMSAESVLDTAIADLVEVRRKIRDAIRTTGDSAPGLDDDLDDSEVIEPELLEPLPDTIHPTVNALLLKAWIGLRIVSQAFASIETKYEPHDCADGRMMDHEGHRSPCACCHAISIKNDWTAMVDRAAGDVEIATWGEPEGHVVTVSGMIENLLGIIEEEAEEEAEEPVPVVSSKPMQQSVRRSR